MEGKILYLCWLSCVYKHKKKKNNKKKHWLEHQTVHVKVFSPNKCTKC